ncbi:MAG TPA: Vps62-related protein [Thermoanaerobaculia bacterium]|nr:Vps62-related protein [Thermoanaerobaculia bacterium]
MTTQSEQGAVSRSDNLAAGSGPRLDRGTTNRYDTICNDKGSHASKDVTFYRPVPPADYFIIGDYAQGNKKNAVGSAVVVKPVDEDPNDPLLQKPLKYELVWNSIGSKPDQPFSIWHPVPPDKYVSVGYVATTGFSEPQIENYRCLRKDMAGEIHRGPEIWDDAHSHANLDVTLYQIKEYPNAFIAGAWEAYEVLFSTLGIRDFSFDVKEYSIAPNGEWGGVTCETSDVGATMFVRAKRHRTEDTAKWFKDAVNPGAAVADMTSSDWPHELDVAFRGTMSFTHLGKRYEGLDIVFGQGYKGLTFTHNWWIGGPHMSAVSLLKVVSEVSQNFGLKVTEKMSVPGAKVIFTADALHTCQFGMGIIPIT